MVKNILGIVVSYVFVALIILLAKVFTRWGQEASRKFTHIMLCNWWFIAMYFFSNAFCACIVPLSFVAVNYISYKKNLIKVIERTDNKKEGLGTVYYAISLFIVAIFSFGFMNRPELGICGILCMGYGDGLAAIVGKAIKSPSFQIGDTKKSLAGCITMFVVCFIIVGAYLYFFNVNFWYVKAAVYAIIAMVLEAVSIKGTDNLTVPVIMTLLVSMIA